MKAWMREVDDGATGSLLAPFRVVKGSITVVSITGRVLKRVHLERSRCSRPIFLDN